MPDSDNKGLMDTSSHNPDSGDDVEPPPCPEGPYNLISWPGGAETLLKGRGF